MFLKILQYSHENTCVGVFFNNVAGLEARDCNKSFSCEYCDSFKSSFFHKTLPVDISQNIFDSDARRCSIKRGFHKTFERLTGKHLCQSNFLNKVSGLGPATLFKKRLRTDVFLRIFKNNFFHRARLVAASTDCQKKESTGEFTKNFLWNQISAIWDNRFSRLLKVLLFATFNIQGI